MLVKPCREWEMWGCNCGTSVLGQTLPLARFCVAHALAQACDVCDDALRANAALLFACKVSASCAWASRARQGERIGENRLLSVRLTLICSPGQLRNKRSQLNAGFFCYRIALLYDEGFWPVRHRRILTQNALPIIEYVALEL